MLVQTRLRLMGPGSWYELVGRGHCKLMRPDGSVVDASTQSKNATHVVGYLVGHRALTADESLNRWEAVQSVAGITEPGRYMLHCAYDTEYARCKQAVQFRIVVTRPTQRERYGMIRYWRHFTLDSEIDLSAPLSRRAAARKAMWYSLQNDFLPELRYWLAREDYNSSDLIGLAGRPNAAAIRMLLERINKDILRALHYVRPECHYVLIPYLIRHLTHADSSVRAMATQLLVKVTARTMGKRWEGYDYRRPTVMEAVWMQHLWQAWWKERG